MNSWTKSPFEESLSAYFFIILAIDFVQVMCMSEEWKELGCKEFKLFLKW